MPPPLALVLTIGFILFLWRREGQRQGKLGALKLPALWVFFVGSRFPTQWLEMLGIRIGGGDSAADGSPLDAVFFLSLILCGMRVLQRRGFSLAEFVRQNRCLTVFFVYCLLAIIWSDFPFVAAKRWIKILGHPVMALVILTDRQPIESLRRVLKVCGYALLPLSVMMIKYFPQYGRGFDAWTGQAVNQGVSLNKNELGYVCLIFGLFFLWDLLLTRKMTVRKERRTELLIGVGFLAMIFWLLRMAQSATSLACLVFGSVTMLALGLRFMSKRYIGTVVVSTVIVVAAGEWLIGIYEPLIRMLGRNPNLTDRTDVWEAVLSYPINPILGAGFESFWLGPRLEVLWAKWWWKPTQAHNGYIEVYINLGYAGLAILVAWIIATFRKAQLELLRHFEFGRYRMAMLFVILAYNYTEATFTGVALIWTMFHIISIDYRVARAGSRAKQPAPEPSPASPDPQEPLKPPSDEPQPAGASNCRA